MPGHQADLGAGPAARLLEDSRSSSFRRSAIAPAGGFHVPYGPNGPTVRITGRNRCQPRRPAALFFAQLQSRSPAWVAPRTAFPSSPTFSPRTPSRTPVYNASRLCCEKRFSHGLQFQAAYTCSKSLDDASTFEESLTPLTTAPAARFRYSIRAQRFVISYDWELPLPKHQGFAGKVVERLGDLRHHAVPERISHSSGHRGRHRTDQQLVLHWAPESPSRVAPFKDCNPKTMATSWLRSQRLCRIRRSGNSTMATQRTFAAAPGSARLGFFRSQEDCLHRTVSAVPCGNLQCFQSHQFLEPGRPFLRRQRQFGQITQARTRAKCSLL